jgi:DNA polymerase III subunit epsilon
MIKWFQHKAYPDFWNNYQAINKLPLPLSINDTTFVVFDTETTGLQPKTDKLLSIGAFKVKNKTIFTSDGLELYIQQKDFKKESAPIHGLRKTGNETRLAESEAIQQFLKFVGNSVLVAHHAAFDITMINMALERLDLPKLKNKYIDTAQLFERVVPVNRHPQQLDLDHLALFFNIGLHDRHTANGDAYITALIFIKLYTQYIQYNGSRLNDFLRSPRLTGLL